MPRKAAAWKVPAPGALALHGGARRLAVVCPKAAEVWVYGLDKPSGQPLLRIGTRPAPSAALFSPDGSRLVVAESAGATLALYNLKDGKLSRRLACPQGPRWLAWSEDGQRLYLGAAAESLQVLRAQDFRTEKGVPCGGVPGPCVVRHDLGAALFTTTEADSLAQLKLADRSLKSATHTDARPAGLAVDAGGQFAWVACQGAAAPLTPPTQALDGAPRADTPAAADAAGATPTGWLDVVRLRDMVLVDRIATGPGCLAVAFSRGGGHVFALEGGTGILGIHDAEGHGRVRAIHLGAGARDMVYDPATERAYVSLQASGEVAVVDLSSFK